MLRIAAALGLWSAPTTAPNPSNASASGKHVKKARTKEMASKKEVLARQKQQMQMEIKQTWRIAMGSIPKKKKDTFLIKDITRRNVWMEELFLFNQIKQQFPDELFYEPEHYILKWQPYGSYFQIIVPLNSPQLQENAVMEMAKMTDKQQQQMLFLFAPLDPSSALFAPKVHPSSLVSYRTKNEVLKKLSEYFLSGKIGVEDLEQILLCAPDVWSNSLYNYLPEDEQVFHTYLNQKIVHEDPNKSIAKQYLDEQISLQEYEDLRFPERKKKAELESMYYPLPYIGEDCIICKEEKAGVVQCQTCDNMVCKPCMQSVFQAGRAGKVDAKTEAKQSFLLMHHRYCMRLGELPELHTELVAEPAYLREFRRSTRLEILARFSPDKNLNFDDDALLLDYDEEEIERKRLLALQLKEQEAEAERLRILQNPPQLQAIRKSYEEKKKKFERLRKELLEVAEKVADTAHTEQFIARNQRLKNELLDKFKRTVQQPVAEMHAQLAQMSMPGEALPLLLREVDALQQQVDVLLISVPRAEI